MIMIIALLIIIVILLGYENWQLYETFTKPRLEHNKMEMEKIYKMYEDITNEKGGKTGPRSNALKHARPL